MVDFNRFSGTASYITSPELRHAVNVAAALQRPLLVRGEPGTGKTLLAHAVAEDLGLELIAWNVESTSKAVDGLYVYDTVKRLQDSRFGDHDVSDIRQYIRLGPLGRALTSPLRVVLLIDEIDKADLEFPNDPLPALFRKHDRETRLVLVGDAHMDPGELTARWGAIDYTERNGQPGVASLERLRDHFRHSAWLNPMPQRVWAAPSVRIVAGVFPMYPLTVAGVATLSKDLSKG